MLRLSPHEGLKFLFYLKYVLLVHQYLSSNHIEPSLILYYHIKNKEKIRGMQ